MRCMQNLWNIKVLWEIMRGSAVLFAPGHAYAEEYRDRGTKACRQWRRLLDVEYPLLPLQNTIALRTEATRRMAVNVEAHVVSYRQLYTFGVQRSTANTDALDKLQWPVAHVQRGALGR